MGSNRWEWAKAGVELRQRICLTFETGEFYFRKRNEEEATSIALNEGTNTVHVQSRSSRDESLNDVMREVSKSVNRNKRRGQQTILTKSYRNKFVKKEKPPQ